MTIPGNQQLSQRFGVEDIVFQLVSAFVLDISHYLSSEQTRGQALDTQLQATTGRTFPAITLESIDALHIHDGHRPSLMNGPITEWPAIAVMAYSLGPAPWNQSIKGQRATRVQISIETIVKSGPYADDDGQTSDGEEVCNRRLTRTVEAINSCVLNHKELAGFALVVDQSPNVSWGELSAISDPATFGDAKRYYWQGARLQYVYDVISLNFTTDQAP